MANDLKSGAQALLERIISAAEADAEKARLEAEAQIKQIEALAEADAEKEFAEMEKRKTTLKASMLESGRLSAELDSRKYLLQRKRELINKAFAAADEKLKAVSGAEREALLQKLLQCEADGGESVCASAKDAAIIRALLEKVNGTLSARGLAPLTMGENADIENGFILVGASYEKDCTFAALLKNARDSLELGVSDILFAE